MIQFFKKIFAFLFGKKEKKGVKIVPAKVSAPPTIINASAVPKAMRQKTLMEQAQVDRKKYRVIGRKFLGELFPNKQDVNYEKKHLRAYLRGELEFTYGCTYDRDGQRHQASHAVKQELILEKL